MCNLGMLICRPMNKWIILCILFISISFQGCSRIQGFTLKKIQSNHPYNPQWDIKVSTDLTVLVNEILSQPFFYLGSGNYCYAFGSSDGKYVLKLLKQKHMDTHNWKHFLLYEKDKIKQKTRTREASFSSYKIAYEELKNETGLIFLHLNKTTNLKKLVSITDQNGLSYQINIDGFEFLIQKKALIGYTYLDDLIQKGLIDESMDQIYSLLSLIVKRGKKGIFDKDMQFFKNFGFSENQPIEVDIGEFRRNPAQKNPEVIKSEVLETSKQLILWINEHYPILLPQVETQIQKVVNEISE